MPVPQPSSNGAEHRASPDTPASDTVDLITEAEALRDLLHQAAVRASRLLAVLKHQRRQTRAVRQAMQSLRQLQMDR